VRGKRHKRGKKLRDPFNNRTNHNVTGFGKVPRGLSHFVRQGGDVKRRKGPKKGESFMSKGMVSASYKFLEAKAHRG